MKSLATTLAFALLMIPLTAHADDTASNMEMAFMPNKADVTLLNENGKFVTVDMKKIAKGEKCRMDKDAMIMKVGPGAEPGTTRVRYIAPQLSHGGCPFMTEFELTNAEYASGRSAFTAKSEEATKKVDDLKHQLGDKWKEITGKKAAE